MPAHVSPPLLPRPWQAWLISDGPLSLWGYTCSQNPFHSSQADIPTDRRRVLDTTCFTSLSEGTVFCMVWLNHVSVQFSSVQSLSRVQLFATPWTAAHQASLSITNSWTLLKFMSIESVMSSNHLILCRPLLLLPSIFPASGSFQMSQLFASGGQSIGASASASVLPMNIQDWFPLGWTGWISLQSKGLSGVSRVSVQHHSSKASILQCSVFFIVQLSYLYMTTGKIIALTRWTSVGKNVSAF